MHKFEYLIKLRKGDVPSININLVDDGKVSNLIKSVKNTTYRNIFLDHMKHDEPR